MKTFKPNTMRAEIVAILAAHPAGLTRPQIEAELVKRRRYHRDSLAPTLTLLKDFGAIKRELGLWHPVAQADRSAA